jgi:hypothetical protein
LTVAPLATAALCVPPAAAAPYCPNPAHAKPAKIPPDLVPAVAKSFALDLGGSAPRSCAAQATSCSGRISCATRPTSAAHCRGDCLVPRKSESERHSEGGDGPRHDLRIVLQGARAVPGKALVTVDPQGYIADNWKEVR